MTRLGVILLVVAMLAAGFGLGVLASAWVETDWPDTDETDWAGA